MKQFTSFSLKKYMDSAIRVNNGFVKLSGAKKLDSSLTVLVSSKLTPSLLKIIAQKLRPFEVKIIKEATRGIFTFTTESGVMKVVLCGDEMSGKKKPASGHLESSEYGIIRNMVGEAVKSCAPEFKIVRLELFGLSSEGVRGSICGIEMGLYKFLESLKNDKIDLLVSSNGKALSEKETRQSLSLGRAVNLARHLVNLPPSHLNPQSYPGLVKALFKTSKNIKVEVWSGERLVKEKMGLMLGVGEGALYGPAMIKISYAGKSAKSSPKVFVGKGITFDTGGLDIKASQFMRLMKKDMGGSAAVLGLAKWVADTQPADSAEFYLAVAENAVSDKAFKPSDVLMARNGKSVEIHNTDAEGRLVLADVLALATEKKAARKPQYIVDVATLTGAIKVALGNDVAGLFSNDESLAKKIEVAALGASDPVWRMPLVSAYKNQLKTPFADLVNSSDGMGGAITAALFLQEFVGDTPWAHLDILAWQSGTGPFSEAGGSGQAVQLLTRLF